MKSFRRTWCLIAAALLCALSMTAQTADSEVENKQQEIRKMAQDTLQTLYKADPRAKSAVENAAGYAVFSNLGVKILVAGSGNGRGIAVNHKTKQEIFMKMLEVQAGLGMGVKKFRVIFRLRQPESVQRICEFRLAVRRTSHGGCEKRR